MLARTIVDSPRPTRAKRRRGSPGVFWALGLAVAGAAVGCEKAFPLDGTLVEWLRVVPGEPPPPAAARVVSDAGALRPDAGPSPSCPADPFEPNDEPAAAALIGGRQPIEAVLCTDADIDYYLFAAPAAAGTQFSVRVRFDPRLGDMDLVLTSAADGVVVAESAGVVEEEVVVAVSDGGQYVLEVALFEPGALAGSPYTLELLVASAAENDCCAESGAPGCSDAGLRECVCALDPYCCVSSYDAYCVQLGVSECGAECAAPTNPGSCCSESSEPGCGDATVEACVCGFAPFCCVGPYDGACVSLAAGLCGGACEEAAP